MVRGAALVAVDATTRWRLVRACDARARRSCADLRCVHLWMGPWLYGWGRLVSWRYASWRCARSRSCRGSRCGWRLQYCRRLRLRGARVRIRRHGRTRSSGRRRLRRRSSWQQDSRWQEAQASCRRLRHCCDLEWRLRYCCNLGWRLRYCCNLEWRLRYCCDLEWRLRYCCNLEWRLRWWYGCHSKAQAEQAAQQAAATGTTQRLRHSHDAEWRLRRRLLDRCAAAGGSVDRLWHWRRHRLRYNGRYRLRTASRSHHDCLWRWCYPRWISWRS